MIAVKDTHQIKTVRLAPLPLFKVTSQFNENLPRDRGKKLKEAKNLYFLTGTIPFKWESEISIVSFLNLLRPASKIKKPARQRNYHQDKTLKTGKPPVRSHKK